MRLYRLGEVIDFALLAHRGQADKAGQPYSLHIGAVAQALEPFGEGAQMAGWLHDVVEDTKTTFKDLERQGLPLAVLDVVRLVTKDPSLPTYLDQIRRVLPNYTATLVKLADNANNSHPERLALLKPETRERLATKYRRARRLLVPNLAPADATLVLARANESLLGEVVQ